jgi:UDP-N-acetylmuramate dehydrogenase
MTDLPFPFAKADYPLASATLYNVGGPARIALFPTTVDEARRAYAWLAAQPGPKLVLGGGSNVLIDDRGFDGIVLFTTHLTGLEALGADRYRVECGVPLDRLVREIMLPNNYDGVGALTGIPGSTGGAIYMNAGTVNGSTCQWLQEAEVLGPEGPRRVTVDATMYSYRGQVFAPPCHLILQGWFQFVRAQRDQQAIYDRYIQRRKEKQPQGYCCGSVFKNPPGDHAGRLIEACGLKGTRLGGAQISPMHANFIMNEDGATFEDITGLIERCKGAVRTEFGVELEEEVRIIRH